MAYYHIDRVRTIYWLLTVIPGSSQDLLLLLAKSHRAHSQVDQKAWSSQTPLKIKCFIRYKSVICWMWYHLCIIWHRYKKKSYGFQQRPVLINFTRTKFKNQFILLFGCEYGTGMVPWCSERKSLPEYLKEIPETAAHQVQESVKVLTKKLMFLLDFFSHFAHFLCGLDLV